MLGSVLSCTARGPPKHWILSHGGGFPLPHHHSEFRRRRILLPPAPAANHCAVSSFRRLERPRGEGSWNVAWDARPARWLHRTESAWLLYGVCACLAQVEFWLSGAGQDLVPEDKDSESELVLAPLPAPDAVDDRSPDYKVTGVLADGRCLFRAIAHGACLRSGEDAPDEIRQRELADDLRARVVEELLKRRKEVEWFIEGDFDEYIKTIEQTYVWGGEPELLMASHVLKTMITVFMIDRESGKLSKVTNYGEEYQKGEEDRINVLFHGYGHYEILETSDQRYQNVDLC